MKNKLTDQLQVEVDASFLYGVLSQNVDDGELASVYRQMSAIENGHAGKIMERLRASGKNPDIPGPSLRARLQVRLGRVLGYGFILNNLLTLERNMAEGTVRKKQQQGQALTGSEMNHYRILDNLYESSSGLRGGVLARIEGRHRSVAGNALRAAVLGANDGLVSNLSLIMGVAGATNGNKEVIIAGMAGMLAGSISMSLGEWLSVQSSRELYQKQIDTEAAELENSPEEEMMELSLIYQSKGIKKGVAEEMAKKVLKNQETALDTLVREELGIDKEDLGGSAWEAAISSFLLFAVGAVIPLVPFLFRTGLYAVAGSLIFSVVGLFVIGAAITLFTGKPFLFSGLRQVMFGLLAAGVTYGIGKLIGVGISG
ncbi:MAG TPA: VIT1/CCC1 transporter family protein [Bacteroidales bacterium]|nr:VIT1/CCC1 transporter family protein [Bacteroidales bacterium]